MATRPRHGISLIITSNNISLSLSIVLIYYLIPNSSPFWYTKPHLSIVGNWLSHITLLRRIIAIILFVGKHSFHHLIAVLILIYQYPICWNSTFFYLDLLGFESPHRVLQLPKFFKITSICLHHKRSWWYQCRSRAFLIGGNWQKIWWGESSIWFLWRILDLRLWQCSTSGLWWSLMAWFIE